MIAFRPATMADLDLIVDGLRAPDRAELEALGRDVRETVHDCLARSRWAFVALDAPPRTGPCPAGPPGGEGAFVAAFGVVDATVIGGHGLTWCLTSDRIARRPRRAALLSKTWVEIMRAEYHTLCGQVAASHTTAVRWLRWMRFTVGDPKPHPVTGALFHDYWWSR